MQRRALGPVLGVLMIGALAGCATGASGTDPEVSAPSASTMASASPEGDAEAAAKAQSWIDEAVLPPGAVRSPEKPLTTGAGFGNESYRWWCSPMELREAYWTIPGTTVVETANWMSEHPTADLIVTNPFGNPANRVVHNATVPNAPTQESLEGIIYTIAEAKDGVAVRALIGVIPGSAVCPTPEPGTSLGGPGQG